MKSLPFLVTTSIGLLLTPILAGLATVLLVENYASNTVLQTIESSIQSIPPLALILGSLCIGLLLGGTVSAVVVKTSITKTIARLSRHMRTLAASTNLSLRLPKQATPVANDLVDAVNSILDTTEDTYLNMLQAQYDAEQANKGKSVFIAKVSHELRTPIHSITGMLRILLKQETSQGKKQYIQMAQDSAHALLGTINEVLDYSKMQGGSLSLENKPFDLVATVRSSVEHLIPRFEEKPSLEFIWDIEPGLAKNLIGDAGRIQNILTNLLGNSFKFTEEGFVSLQISRFPVESHSKMGVQIVVSDSGIGIPSDKLSRIFDPFTTADEVTARLYPGTGLGLAIVKQLVESMGGTVAVSSIPKKGSTFTLSIPFEVDAESSFETYAPQPKAIAVLASPSKRNQTLAHTLQSYGSSVSTFSLDSGTAINAVSESIETFDALFIEKSESTTIDDLNPLIEKAVSCQRPVILSVKGSEIASMEISLDSHNLIWSLQPTSALDLLLAAEGSLVPSTALDLTDDITERSSHRLRIIVADDAQTNRIILKNLLEDAGHDVEVVENGRDLLERIISMSNSSSSKLPFDLVLTDIQMPVMDGLTATQNFRKLEREVSPRKKLPIVAVTSYAFPEECSKMLASGIDHIITKPISPKRLSNLLSQITCEVQYSDKELSRRQSDSEIIEELCKVATAVSDRVSSFSADIQELCPILFNQTINISDVYERSGNSIKRTGLILQGFIDSYRPLLRTLEESMDNPSDNESLGRCIHAIKGLLLDIGAETAASLGNSLEETLLCKKQPVVHEKLGEFIDAIRNAALIVQEVATALPSVELFSALPSTDINMPTH
jgi:signal transduction histidine kinase/CheY-like chemotaxis protein